MKFVVYGQQGRLGVIQGDRILDLALAAHAGGTVADDGEVFTSLLTLIEAGDRGLDRVRRLLEQFEATDQPGLHTDLSATHLHPPFPGRRFAFAGGNYAAHVARGYANRGRPITAEEVYSKTREGKAGGFWVVSPPAGPHSDIPVPNSADGLFDYEGEVAVVLGKGGKRLSADRWENRVWGTTLVIDWSIRSHTEIAFQAPFYAHKNFDHSKSIGPWITVDEVDPNCCEVETRVNGQVRQRFNSRDMIHSFGELLEQISEDLTLLPGDVLSGGTGPGTAVDSTIADPDGRLPLDLFLKAGDIVEVTSPHLGSLQARIVASA
ncbi:fumarylacetoacetate hydrolase family protein [Nocardia sp. bgisy118]|uniref:fumarylacetoacetate hydrolase family protein n=1 Tax=Nocardia sp. bgisy118 TaxID=3413786 RepID=UPI003F4A156A